MSVKTHVCTDNETGRTFQITIENGWDVIALDEKPSSGVTMPNGETFDEGVWIPVPKDSEWWEQWQGEAACGAFDETIK